MEHFLRLSLVIRATITSYTSWTATEDREGESFGARREYDGVKSAAGTGKGITDPLAHDWTENGLTINLRRACVIR